MVDNEASMPADYGFAPMLTALETQLSELDRHGCTIAAAHLDAAIHQLRLDQAGRVVSLRSE